MAFHWNLSDSKSPQIPGALLSILADFNNAVVWMVSAHPLISNSSNLFYYSIFSFIFVFLQSFTGFLPKT